jgi:hypothetical protein
MMDEVEKQFGDEIAELACTFGYCTSGWARRLITDFGEKVFAAAYAAALEQAAGVAVKHKVTGVGPSGAAHNAECDDIAAAIHALKTEP